MQRILGLAAVALLLCGCGGNTPGSSVNLVREHLQTAAALVTTATFIIRLSNDAPEARQFTGSAHKINLNGLYVGRGLSDKTVEAPQLCTVTQESTVHLNNLALATRLKSMMESKRFNYPIQSVFYRDGWPDRVQSEGVRILGLNDFTPTPEPQSTNAPLVEPAVPSSNTQPDSV